MRTRFIILLTLLLTFAAHAFADVNANRKDLAAGGYDLVTYFQGREEGPKKGDKDFVASYDGYDYLFSSEENLALFEENPEQYLPQYGGYCAWAMLEGEKVDVNPKFYKIVDGKLYLYYKGLLGNTLDMWNELAETEPENEMIETADHQWSSILEQ